MKSNAHIKTWVADRERNKASGSGLNRGGVPKHITANESSDNSNCTTEEGQ